MTATNPLLLIIAGPVLFGVFVYVAESAAWRLLRRHRKYPFPENPRLLRQPGESAQLRVRALEERMLLICLTGGLTPLLAGTFYFCAITYFIRHGAHITMLG